jgi:hypothetical protein
LGTTNYNLGASGSNGVVIFHDLAVSASGSNNQLVASTDSSAASPFPGMSIWLDGSLASSVVTNATGIVTNWLDQSGNGNNFGTSIGTGGGGIRYTNTAANGRKTVSFNASSGSTGTALKNTSYTNTSKTVSAFVVAKKTVPGTGEGGYQHIFATWAGGANPDYADPGSYSLDYNSANTTPRVIRGCCTSYVDNNCPAIDPSTNYHVFEYVANGTGSNSIWLATAGGTTTGAGPLFGNLSANFNVAATTVGGGMLNGAAVNNPFAGSIAEVLVYNSALSTADRLSVQSYLTNKWLGTNGDFALTGVVSAPFDVLPSGPPPAQSIVSITAGGTVTISYATTPGFTYHIEVATSLYPANWSTVPGSATNASGTVVTFPYSPTPGAGPLYYRTVSP